jgi:hypothetical protein
MVDQSDWLPITIPTTGFPGIRKLLSRPKRRLEAAHYRSGGEPRKAAVCVAGPVDKKIPNDNIG